MSTMKDIFLYLANGKEACYFSSKTKFKIHWHFKCCGNPPRL